MKIIISILLILIVGCVEETRIQEECPVSLKDCLENFEDVNNVPDNYKESCAELNKFCDFIFENYYLVPK